MKIQNGALPTGSACPNSAQRYLFTLAPVVLLFGLEVLLWIA